MTRATSAAAYQQIKDDGLLGNKQMAIYDWLYSNGPATANEIFRGTKGATTITQANTHARLNELRKAQAVVERDKVLCDITGKKVLRFDVSNCVAIKPLKRITNQEKIKRLEAVCKYLIQHVDDDKKKVAREIYKA